jgi:hypothetical protein
MEFSEPTTQIFEVHNSTLNSTPFLLKANGDMAINNGIQNIFHLYSNGVLSLHGDNGIESFRVEGSGLVRCRKIKVDTQTWPDYVFEKDYHLMPLKELEEYIQTNKHLPNIPCQEQVLKDGVELGEMNVKLLEKIEELTRYLIEQNKELKVLKEEVNQLKNGKL